jgi:hypothetical protein
MQSKRLYEVNEQQLELFVCRMFSVVDKVGIETVTHAANEVVRDLVNAETLLQLPEETTPDLTEMVERVTSRITPSDGKGSRALRRLVLAGALLLAVGASIFIPLIAPVAAEVILANEVAVASVTVTVATLLRTRQGPLSCGY